jgi:hypothetical protein
MERVPLPAGTAVLEPDDDVAGTAAVVAALVADVVAADVVQPRMRLQSWLWWL